MVLPIPDNCYCFQHENFFSCKTGLWVRLNKNNIMGIKLFQGTKNLLKILTVLWGRGFHRPPKKVIPSHSLQSWSKENGCLLYTCPSVSEGDWFQDLSWIPKFKDAQFPWSVCIHGSTCMAPTNCRSYGTVVFTEKNMAYKWTNAVQTHVVQGSTVIILQSLLLDKLSCFHD